MKNPSLSEIYSNFETRDYDWSKSYVGYKIKRNYLIIVKYLANHSDLFILRDACLSQCVPNKVNRRTTILASMTSPLIEQKLSLRKDKQLTFLFWKKSDICRNFPYLIKE